jgi:hypothetical protein
VYSEVGPGNDALTEVRLGHRVAIDYEAAGVASLVRIEAALAGPVGAVSGGGQFTMLGQTVTTNAGAATGPITQFGGGYARATDVQPGDSTEVHGLLVRQTSGYVIQATRIDKLPAAPAYLRVTGLAGALVASSSVMLGTLKVDTSAANVLPVGTALASGQTMTVLASPASLVAAASGAAVSVKAAQVRVRLLGGSELDDYVSGSVSQLDTTAKTFTIGSLVVRYAAAALLPAGTALASGQYVLVQGRVGADAALAATSVTIRNTASDEEGELKGNLSGFALATKRFTVRGVSVDASGARLSGCPSAGLADGLFVEVRGALVGTGVVAKTVQCEAESASSTVERKGTVSVVDTTAKTFTLVTKASSVVSVKWSDKTFFDNLSPAALAGKAVQVEGQLSGSVLMAAKVEPAD